MRFTLLVPIACAAIAGCQSSQPPQTVAAPPVDRVIYKLSPAMTEKIKKAVAAELKDPDSARFDSPIAATKTKDEITACGFVNAKNSFGGYTGNKPFLVTGFESTGVFVPIGIGGSDSETMAVLQVCKAHLDLPKS
jgi:hypothetical protein